MTQQFHLLIVSQFVTAGAIWCLLLYLAAKPLSRFLVARPCIPANAHGVQVPVSQSPYTVAPTRRTRLRGTSSHGRVEDELLFMRRLQRELRFRNVSTIKMRGIA